MKRRIIQYSSLTWDVSFLAFKNDAVDVPERPEALETEVRHGHCTVAVLSFSRPSFRGRQGIFDSVCNDGISRSKTRCHRSERHAKLGLEVMSLSHSD